MAERHAVAQLVTALNVRGVHVQRIENSFGVGIPDLYVTVEGVSRWIEVKHVRAWPARATTIVKCDEPFKPAQRVWFHRELAAGGDPVLAVRAERVWFFFSGHYAGQHVEVDATKADWYQHAFHQFTTPLSAPHVCRALASRFRLL